MNLQMKQNRTLLILLALFVVMMSLPFLVPHCGVFALVGLVPLLCAERIATRLQIKRFWAWYFLAFLLFNGLTTWWVSMATVGGGIFASLYSAAWMSMIFGLFRLSRKKFDGPLPYIFLMVAWIAWERYNLVLTELSWPWIVLGNAFARSTTMIQWYEYTGTLGGSLWIWASNLSIFGAMVSLSEGNWFRWNNKARAAAVCALVLFTVAPMFVSAVIYHRYCERSDAGTLDVAAAQSNFDPWQKRISVPQSEQNAQVVRLFADTLAGRAASPSYPERPLLMVLPESFTSDIWMNDPQSSRTWRTFSEMVSNYPNSNLIFGASTFEIFNTLSKPNDLARKYGRDSWYLTYNTAFLTDVSGRISHVHKSKLVIGSEFTPYPKIFVPLDDMLGGVMGRCVPQREARTLEVRGYDPEGQVNWSTPIGVPICYESIYGEFCTGYAAKGATALAIITNDGWWGNTPGYRQHFSYSRLRAIETRRDIIRCANTGISAVIDQRGDVVRQSGWWVPDCITGTLNLSDEKTFFVRYGDITGRVCTFVFILLALLLAVRFLTKK